jgi:hypothetical protein
MVGLTAIGAGASCTTRTCKNAGERASSVDEAGCSPLRVGVLSASRRASSLCQNLKVAGFRLFRWQYAWMVRSLCAWPAMVRRRNCSLRGSLCSPRRVFMANSRRKDFACGKCYQAMQDAVRYALTPRPRLLLRDRHHRRDLPVHRARRTWPLHRRGSLSGRSLAPLGPFLPPLGNGDPRPGRAGHSRS